MAHKIGYVDDQGSEGCAHWQMLRLIRDFAGGYGTFTAPTFSGAGDGALVNIDTDPDSVTETWTIKCTDATTAGAETWSVTGSVSGAQADATTGVAYTSSLLSFAINTGATAFAVGDTFTLDVTAGAMDASERWQVMHYATPDGDTDRRELVLKGQGLSGDKEIYIGFSTYQSVSADYYNLTVAGFIGYIPGTAWDAQPGFIEKGVPAHNQHIDYWLTADGQSINLGLKVGTPVYESGGAGFFLPYASPDQYGYPMYVSGMLNGAAATRYSDTSHSMGWKGNRSSFVIRNTLGQWVQPTNYPWSNARVGGSTSQLRDTNDQYPILPIVLYQSTPNLWGELAGIGYVSNFNNTVESVIQKGGTPVTDNPAWTSAERVQAIIDAGGEAWLCLQDVARTSFNDYFALRMA